MPNPENLAEEALVDPTSTNMMSNFKRTPRSDDHIVGPVGLFDINKFGGKVFLDRIQELLLAKIPTLEIQRFAKPTFSRPAPKVAMLYCFVVATSRCRYFDYDKADIHSGPLGIRVQVCHGHSWLS